MTAATLMQGGAGEAPLSPLAIDGSLEQRDELAALLLELDALKKRLSSDHDRATAVLRNLMVATKTRRIELDGATIELRSAKAWWCIRHHAPPPYCVGEHEHDEPVQVYEVTAEPYLAIKRRGSDASI